MSNEERKDVWNFEDEDGTFELVREIRDCLYTGYYTYAIGDEFSEGRQYVIKNLKLVQTLDRASQIELVRMGYSELATDMGLFSHALHAIAERGTTAFYVPDLSSIL